MTSPTSPSIRHADDYFATNDRPSHVDPKLASARSFISQNHALGRRIVLLTSGGTTVPLEQNTVRFVDNFSAGTRGAISGEQFLENGYAVIFMHRHGSLQPYARRWQGPPINANEDQKVRCWPLEWIIVDDDGSMSLRKDVPEDMKRAVKMYKTALNDNRLLLIDFVTVRDYLWLLRDVSQVLGQQVGKHAMWYLAAAVSDFYLPPKNLSEHKIQSGLEQQLVLKLDQVPKVLSPLVQQWAASGFIISFKLETDQSMLRPKSIHALKRYRHQVVVGNLLQDRKRRVTLVERPKNINDASDDDYTEQAVCLSPEEEARGVEIEERIVPEMIRRHDAWIK